jgi:threonine synthase
MIRMQSTRDGEGREYSYTDVLLSGLAPDGGLYVPSEYPQFSTEELVALKDAPYAKIAHAVKRKLVDGAIADEDLMKLIEASYTPELFALEEGRVVPATHIERGLYVQNLSLGPTASFKDMAMQLLAREMQHELKARGEELIILGATSGDTGSAAEAAFKAARNVKLFMLSPEEGMSDFQKAQMGALSGGNVFNISIRGRFDDCQNLVKAVKGDEEFAKLGAVNSINWGRISSQIPYYLAGYLQVAKHVGEPVDFAVPSGNFGNALSGYYAKRMGLPIRRIIVATNENNVLHKLFSTGVYEVTSAQVTSSPSMDISKASNYERLAFDVLGRDATRTAAYMKEFAESGKVSLADHGADADAFSNWGFESGSSTHADRLAEIRHVHETSGICIDPHTADGVHVGRQKLEDGTPMLALATALPVKFEDTVREALGTVPERPARFKNLETSLAPDAFTTLDPDAEALKAFIRSHI